MLIPTILILILTGSITSNSISFAQSAATTSASATPLPSIFDLPKMKIISSNASGYEAEAPLQNSNGLVWHISVNTKPHVQYAPTQQDIQRIQSTGQPLYNVKTQNAITTNTISSKISFFVPYSALTGSSSTTSTPGTHIPHQSQPYGGGNFGGATSPSQGTATQSTSSSSPLTANDQSITTNVNNPVSITLGGSSSNPNADLTATIVNSPAHGTLSQIDQQTGAVIYTPNQDYVGTDSFTFKVNDGNQDSSNTGTVSITVTNGSGNGNSNSNTGATDGNNNNQQTQQQQNAHFQTQLQKLSLSSEPTTYSAVTTATTSSPLLATSSSLSAASAVIPVAEASSSPTQQPQQQNNGEGESGPLQTFNNGREKVEGVEGTIFEFLEGKEVVSEGAAEFQENILEQVSNLIDAYTSYKEIHDTFQELKELEDCRESSPLQQGPSPKGAITGDEQVAEAKSNIISDFLFQAFASGMAKLLGGSILGGKALEIGVTKYGEGVFKTDLDYRMALIKAVSKCFPRYEGTLYANWKDTDDNGAPWQELWNAKFSLSVNKPFSITSTGPKIEPLDTAGLPISGSGKGTLNAKFSGDGIHDCTPINSAFTFSISGTFSLKNSNAQIFWDSISPLSLQSTCRDIGGTGNMTTGGSGGDYTVSFTPLFYNVLSDINLDLSNGHAVYENPSNDGYLKITVDKVEGSQQPQPELKPFSGKFAQSSAGSSTLTSLLSRLTASDQSISIKANNPVSIILGGSSSNPNADLTASILANPSHGTLSTIDQSSGKVTYTPQPGYTGSDSFTFKVNDGKQDSNNTGTVSISIGGTASGDAPAPSIATTPTAADQSITTSTNTPVDITLSGTDPNPNADLSASIVSNPAHGTLSQIDQATGKVTYTPQSDYTGPDRFTFKVNDGNSNSNEATVNITIK